MHAQHERPPLWKQAKLHPDCHVVFAGAYCSAPHRLIGQRLWVRATAAQVQLFHQHALVATHLAARPGQRRTLHEHLPLDKVHFLLQTPRSCQEQATAIGPTCAAFMAQLLGDRPLDRLRGAQGVLRLAQRYGAARLEAACARATAAGECRYGTVKTIRQSPQSIRAHKSAWRAKEGGDHRVTEVVTSSSIEVKLR